MIREANQNDFLCIDQFLNEMNLKTTSVNILQNPFSKIYVYDYKEMIAGFISISKYFDRMEIDYIYISEKNRQKGIASELLNYIINTNKDISNITLEVSENNIPAIKLYEKFKFEIVAKRERYYQNGVNAYLMERK